MRTNPAGREAQRHCGVAVMSWLASPATAASGVAARVKSAAFARLGPGQGDAGHLSLALHAFIRQQIIEVRHYGLRHNLKQP